ncbi:MAG TPA: erythromycin esterase family protein [Ktedonobacteraceae bacterium]|nr:erythromycin esterase family protein [Ktedonobacteraceae bacterium]
MTYPTPTYATLDDWIAHEAIPFSLASRGSFNAAVDKLMASPGNSVELLGLGEALHGGEDLLLLRNRLFQHLVEAHGYSAIAIESSFSRAHLVNEYVAGRGSTSYEAVQDTGFSHGFGQLFANRELVEWMRHYNADPTHHIKLQFYGFDSPTEMMGNDSPRQVLHFVLNYLASIDEALSQHYRSRINQLLGPDAAWENPAATMDPTQSIGLEPAATALRLETEELIADLQVRRPELVTKSNARRYLEALQYAGVARQLLNYHAALARDSSDRVARLLGMRDVLMADNLAYMVARERGQGNVLVFAHNSHLQRGKTAMRLGSEVYTWWPTGSHLQERLGSRYAVIGSAIGESLANGIGLPEAGTLERRFTDLPGPVRFLPTHRGQGLPASAIATLPIRSGSVKNPTYFALTSQSLIDFDWLVVLDTTTYSRGGPPLSEESTSARE